MGQINKFTKGSALCAVLGAVDPQSVASGVTVTSGWVPAHRFGALMVTLMAGAISAGGSLGCKLQQATALDGTGTKDVPGAAVTALAAPAGSAKQSVVNVGVDALDVNGGFKFVRVAVTATGAAALAAAILHGLDPRELPASDNDADSVAEIVNV